MSLRVEINLDNMDLSEKLRDYVEKKVEKLDRYLDILEEAQVDLRYAESARSAQDRQVAQLTVRGKGAVLRAEERSDDIFTSFDAVISKIHRQIERYKGRHWRSRGDGRSISDFTLSRESGEAEEVAVKPRIVRRKRFSLTPMDEEEAIEQMTLLGHEDFFVFYNINNDQINVLYKRRDGNFGLIETELA